MIQVFKHYILSSGDETRPDILLQFLSDEAKFYSLFCLSEVIWTIAKIVIWQVWYL